MGKVLISLAAATAAVVAAAPASAQYYQAPPRPGPEAGYGYQGQWGQVRELQARLDNIRRQIDRLDRRDAIRGRAADRLMDQANRIDRGLHEHARNGLNPREFAEVSYRIQQLEQQVRYAAYNRYDRDRGDRY